MSKISLATVTAVDVDNWMVSATTLDGHNFPKVLLATPYTHNQDGAITGPIPEVGSLGYLLQADVDDQKDMPSMFAFRCPFNYSEGFKGGKPESDKVQEGDFIIRANGGTEILVKKSGDIIMSSGTGIAQRQMSGETNSIRDICSNYSLTTAGGFLEWRQESIVPDAAGLTPYTLSLGIKKNPLDVDSRLLIELGEIFLEPEGIAKIKLNTLPGIPAGTYEFSLDILGNVIEQVLSKKIAAVVQIVLEGIVRLGGETAANQSILGNIFSDLFLHHVHDTPKGGESFGPLYRLGPTTVPINPVTQGWMNSSLSTKVFVE